MSIPDIVYKAHGTGNDFVVYADPEGIYEPSTEEVVRLTDRHRGIGGDGLLRITRPQFVSDLSEEDIRAAQADDASWFMDYRNADGSLAQMCGNGTRVTALFIRRMCMLTGEAQDDKPLRLATRAGVKILSSLGDDELLGQDVFRVDMGKWAIGPVMGHTVSIPGVEGSARGTYVNMGNPHVVCLIEDGSASYTEALESSQATLPALTTLDLSRKPVVSPVLDEGQNVEFVRIESVDPLTGQGRAFMRVHERGVGETLSCGTGLCATGVTLRALTGISHWTIHVLGGVLDVDVDDESVRLTGSATIVARIELNPQH
ncbi:diaminopimelate epimerase [Bifidobacterium psychraerophilum]|jgi:diaminopimelate epimerase|uniref:diaminopimelate epimerase n=1 Tax=Bifidobacterium psychraerophilum TaxID=218140 RepID=UPI0023F56BA9|nr:diaminopimelate epimerase [Bifidobacterium psychraerophilum]MCI1804855.1 diaminopimelate epimerase [Bifidobacterium psychraerophilum]MCI2176809.1 diaminopimelate epimerase [Bifidobacterium psychraerophilum]MCI2182605.1 diaminopimelate epimerase [Bifidobacterium psychraerophilum]